MRRLAFTFALLAAPLAAADERGFQLNRYEPTPAGEMTFAVEHPWYSATRPVAAGLTLDYGHNPLVLGIKDASGKFTRTEVVVAHQLVGHLDLAMSLFDRLTLSATLPVTFLERGRELGGAAPISGAAFGDPRLGAMIRLYGHPDQEPFSLSLGAHAWVPIGVAGQHAGDTRVRALPKLVLAGMGLGHLRWSLTAGYLVREAARIGELSGANAVGQELQLGAAVGYACAAMKCHIGPEAVLGTLLTDKRAFKVESTSIELLAGVHVLLGGLFQLGGSIGMGLLRLPGTPDFRALLRLAYAPGPKVDEKREASDRDRDGIFDDDDACPDRAGPRSAEAKENGCPPRPDRDRDGVLDDDDACPDRAMGHYPDPTRRGCPAGDGDHDGVFDHEDACRDLHHGAHPDPARRGCPAPDGDGDGLVDHEDQCPREPMGPQPDLIKRGCPVRDRDGDTIFDAADACPDQPGAPSPDPKKNGCPGLVQVKGGMIVILRPVLFATGRDLILPKSFPVLTAVRDALVTEPEIKRVSIEGHTDDRGGEKKNLDLSDRRAKSVRRWMIEHGIAPERLEAHGVGETRPVVDNRTSQGRATNRRVEFRIVE